jgi:hypothetical protein
MNVSSDFKERGLEIKILTALSVTHRAFSVLPTVAVPIRTPGSALCDNLKEPGIPADTSLPVNQHQCT